MKKIFLYFMFIILCSQIVFSSEKCKSPNVDIYVDLVSKIRGTEDNSPFQFHYFRETDILWL